MELTKLTSNLNIVSALADLPNATDGLTAAQLKAKFDEGPNEIKAYINDTLTTEIDAGFVTKTDLTTNRKLSATGDFTGTWNGVEMIDSEPGLSSAFAALKVELADYMSVEKYGINVTRDTFFNGDPTNGTTLSAWSDRQIVLIGDSHAWGEGSPNYQGASSGYSIHAPWIHNDGFFGRLMKYLYDKWNSEPWRVIPLFNKANPVVSLANAVLLNASNNTPLIFQDLYTKTPRIVKGVYYITCLTSSGEANQPAKDNLTAFANAETREDSYASTYMYNADIGLFGKGMITLAQDGSSKSNICFEMVNPSRYAIVSLYCFANFSFGKARIELLDDTDCNNDGSPNYEQVVTGFGNPNYGTAAPSVYTTSGTTNTSSLVVPPNVTIESTKIVIDTSYAGMNNEGFYIIDFKQKKKGTIRISYDSAGVSTNQSDSVLLKSVIRTRGVIFGNRDLVRNFGFGGHTTSAMLGTSASYWEETRNHIADIKAYMTGNIKSLIIEAPIVNEHIVQTPIETFKTNLTSIMSGLNASNAIIFTTIGQKSMEFGTDTGAITYEQYAQAVEDWATSTGGQVTFVDCRSYLKGLVTNDIVSSNDLYINDSHPSSLSNELIYKMLKKVVDMKF